MIKDILEHNRNVQPADRTLAKLHADFPQCFDKEGKFNIETFRSLVSEHADISRESYGLDFLGRSYAGLIANTDTDTVILPDEANNAKPENARSRNVYITGDNLDGLKHLLKSYTGAVKCIYIDPPYNTGKDDFVYSDRFRFTAPELASKLGMDEEKAARILDLTTRRSSSHSAWLTFMAARLSLARDLLTPDGVIFISIDDNEQANLKLLCDGIFGEENFVCNFIWKSKSGGANDSKYVAVDHEYILCYANKVEKLGTFMDKDATVSTVYNQKDEYGEYALDRLDKQSLGYEESLDFPIKGPDGKIYSVIHKNPNNKVARWRWGKNTVRERYNELVFKDGFVYTKNYKKDAAIFRSLLMEERFGRTRTGKTDFTSLFPAAYFSSPKPVKLIKALINVCTQGDDTILDFFSGSGTTAHAVMQMNADDVAAGGEGKRRFIMVQLDEETKPDSEARKAGYETIDRIGMERIRRAAAKIREENPMYADKLDLGFKHFTLKAVPQSTLDKLESFDPRQSLLSDDNTLRAFGEATVVRTWMVSDGYGFSIEPKKIMLSKAEAYRCEDHLYILSGENLDENAVAALVEQYGKDPHFPKKIVAFGYSLNYEQNKMLRENINRLQKDDNGVSLQIRY